MATYHVFQRAPFPPELIEVMTAVFEEVSRERGLVARRDPICNLVANAILDCAHRGIRDPEKMKACAHKALGLQ